MRMKDAFALAGEYRNSLADDSFYAAAKVEDDGVLLVMHGDVGDEWQQMDSGSVASFLQQHTDKPVHVSMNSYGGLVFDGLAIHNALVDHPKPTSGVIDGLAASAMSIIAAGLDQVAIKANAAYMIHEAWGVCVGNKRAMTAMYDRLSIIDNAIVETYTAKASDLSREDVAELMKGDDDGTWMTAERAHELGFVDDVIPVRESSRPTKGKALARIAGERARISREKAARAVAVLTRRAAI